jgi:hypothetical protein
MTDNENGVNSPALGCWPCSISIVFCSWTRKQTKFDDQASVIQNLVKESPNENPNAKGERSNAAMIIPQNRWVHDFPSILAASDRFISNLIPD